MPETDEDERQLHQPHDKLFKAGFSDPVNAAAFLAAELPPAVSAAIDWDALALEAGSFVDTQFRHSESDLLFSAPWRGEGGNALVYVLFEHQSQLDPKMPLRLLRYMTRIWEKHKGALPVIIPVVLAQNATHWDLVPEFIPMFHVPSGIPDSVMKYVPNFTYQLVQLADMPVERIVGTPAGIMVLRVLRAERRKELYSPAVWEERLILMIPRSLRDLIVNYIFNAGGIDRPAFEDRMREFHNAEVKQDVMTAAQYFRQEGQQEGRVIAARQSVLDALEVRFETVPDGLRDAVNQLDDYDQLRRLATSAIRAASIEEFSHNL